MGFLRRNQDMKCLLIPLTNFLRTFLRKSAFVKLRKLSEYGP